VSVTMTGFDHEVAWREFQRRESRPAGESEDAYIEADKNVDYDFSGSGSNWQVTDVRATIEVDQVESWVVQGKETDELLEHEQGHFDITALGMREEANRTAALTGTSGSDIDSQYAQIRLEINRKIAQANARYDTRTDHSNNKPAQRRWLRSIQAAKSRNDGTIDDLPN